ncbi:MAG: FapA family protein [Clostridiales Family XIII bacterium]|nr:FapA family protein [Clostridiales Family XIII bacterium]
MGKYTIRINVNADNTEAAVLLGQAPDDRPAPLTQEDLLRAATNARIAFGLDKATLRALAEGPLLDTEIPIARGIPATDGTDGFAVFHVKKSDEFKPNYGGDDAKPVDYKNVDVFQLVEKGSVLCEITQPTQGTDGTNVYGGVIPARPGKPALNPRGTNTDWSEDGSKLLAAVTGVVNFNGTVINVMEQLRIAGDVDLSTGNVRFGGDIVIRGSVNENFIVECGGNLIVKGKIGGADVRVGGNLIVAEGVNGSRQRSIIVDGFMRARYIENGAIKVKGDLFADYIIDSNVECRGNISLSGAKSVLVGGRTAVFGELSANYMGNERGIRTRVELLESPVDEEALMRLMTERERLCAAIKSNAENVSKLRLLMNQSDKPEIAMLHKQLAEQAPMLKGKLRLLEEELLRVKGEGKAQYPGRIVCRRILYSGVDIFAGGLMLQRDHRNLEHCKLSIDGGDWAVGLA